MITKKKLFILLVLPLIVGIISTSLSAILMSYWKTKPSRVVAVGAVIILVSIVIMTIRMIGPYPRKKVLYAAVPVIIIAECVFAFIFWKQLTQAPDLHGLSQAEARRKGPITKVKPKIVLTNCGDHRDSIVFQDPDPGARILKGSEIVTVFGEPKVEINSPRDLESAPYKLKIEGSSCGVSKTELKIYTLIHPVETDKWWVQRPTEIEDDGEWSAHAQLAEKASDALLEDFEIVAIVTTLDLKVNSTHNKLPRYINRSNIITVTKGKP